MVGLGLELLFTSLIFNARDVWFGWIVAKTWFLAFYDWLGCYCDVFTLSSRAYPTFIQ